MASIALHGRNPTDLKVAELKLWLQERKKSMKGKKPILSRGILWFIHCRGPYSYIRSQL